MSSTPLEYTAWRETPLGAITERLERSVVLDLAGPLAAREVLDVGCGDGAYALAAARAGARVTGLDRSTAALARARERAGSERLAVDLLVGDIGTLPLPADRFDLVLAVTVLCFVEEPARAVAEMARVLRPGGLLVLGELGKWSTWAAWRRLRSLARSDDLADGAVLVGGRASLAVTRRGARPRHRARRGVLPTTRNGRPAAGARRAVSRSRDASRRGVRRDRRAPAAAGHAIFATTGRPSAAQSRTPSSSRTALNPLRRSSFTASTASTQ